jgi:hypothetical protein
MRPVASAHQGAPRPAPELRDDISTCATERGGGRGLPARRAVACRAMIPAFAGGLTSAAADSQSGVDVCNCRGLSVFSIQSFAPIFLQGNGRVTGPQVFVRAH